MIELPERLRPFFGEYGIVLYDSYCGEAIAWGFRAQTHLGKDLWAEAEKLGTWECIEQGVWVLVVRWLTPEEAIETYGPLIDIEEGLGSVYRSATYGAKKFVSSWLKPTTEMERAFWAVVKPEDYEWVFSVMVRLKIEKPKSKQFIESPSELRALSEWYFTLATLRERMEKDGWICQGDTFTRIERTESGYQRSELKAILRGLDVYIGQVRKMRRPREAIAPP